MYEITFQQFKDELTELFNSAVTGGHPDYCNLRIYDELPYNQAKKFLKKNFKELWWCIFDFGEVYTGIITYEPDCSNLNMYLEYNRIEREGEEHYGNTMKIGVACTPISAWCMLGLHILQIELGAFFPDRNDVWYTDDNATPNFLNGDCPFELPPEKTSFVKGMKKLIEAKRHPDKEWKGQRICLKLEGMFDMPEFVIEF